MTEEYALVDERLFEDFSERVSMHECVEDLGYNYCTDCRVPMSLSGTEYQCLECGFTQVNEGVLYKDHGETFSTNIRVGTGANKGRFYNNTSDYTKTQKKAILDLLRQCQASYAGPKFSPAILEATATQYNNIQKYITEDEFDENGVISGQKKFVRRGNIKDEVIAAIMSSECRRAKAPRKSKDIAIFMRLAADGFARGEDILRNLEAKGKIELPPDEDSVGDFVERYMEALNLENDNYAKFVVELVEESERLKIGMGSQLSSKIVGAIWILITKCKINITAQALEKATDNTKKNTFIKFYNIVFGNLRVFGPIFNKYKVPKL